MLKTKQIKREDAFLTMRAKEWKEILKGIMVGAKTYDLRKYQHKPRLSSAWKGSRRRLSGPAPAAPLRLASQSTAVQKK